MRCAVVLTYLIAIQLIVTIFSPHPSFAQDILALNGNSSSDENKSRKAGGWLDKRTKSVEKLRPLQTIRSIDEETELLLNEVLNLGSDLAILMEEKNNPYPLQVLVLISLAKIESFDLQQINLEIDSKLVASYQYTAADNHALFRGGSHRLLLTNLTTGLHTLTAEVIGKFSSNKHYKRQIKHILVSGVSRTVIEIDIRPTSKSTTLKLVVKEWD